MSGAIQIIVTIVIPVPIVILELNNNFILRFTNPRSVMIFNRPVIVREDLFVHLLMSRVSFNFQVLNLIFLINICVTEEISAARDLSMDSSTDLAQLLSSALPPTSNTTSSASSPVSIVPRSNSTSNTNNQSRSTSTVASSLPDFSSGFDFSAPQPPLHLRDQHTPLINSIHTVPGPIARPRSYSTSTATTSNNNDLLSSYLEKHNGPMKNNTSSLFSGGASSPLFPGMGTAAGLFYPAAADTVGSVVGSALEDLNLDDINLEASLEKDLCGSMDNVVNETNSVNSVLRSNVLVSTAPVNIPGNNYK